MEEITIRLNPQIAARFMAFLGTPHALLVERKAPPNANSARLKSLTEGPTVPPRRTRRTGEIEYSILDERRWANTAIDAYCDIVATILSLAPEKMDDVAAAVAGRSRRYIATSRASLIPGRPDLCDKAAELTGGLFVDTNVANRDKQRVLQKICEVVGLEFGKDIKIELPIT